jgi:hypothetical protein
MRPAPCSGGSLHRRLSALATRGPGPASNGHLDRMSRMFTMSTHPLRITALLALLVLPITALAWDLDCRYGAERKASIDMADAARVEIMARAGELTVRPGSGTTLAAVGRACASSQAFLDQTQLHVRRQGDVVQVHVQVPDEMKGIGLLYASLDLTVSVPGDLPVEVTDSSGDMTLENVRVTKVRDSSGDISARGLKGDVEIDDSSGDIRVADVGGNVEVLADGSGQVSVTGVRGTVNLP